VHADPAPAAGLCRRVLAEHPAPDEWRVFPRVPFPTTPPTTTEDAPLPPLLKGYLRLGAVAGGPPAWDPAFGTADLLLILKLAAMAPRWRARLTRERW
jgi:putative hemolysin